MKTLKTLFYYMDKVGKKFTDDAIDAYAAMTSFFSIVSAFPFAMLILSIIQYLPFSQVEFINYIESLFPKTLNSFVVAIIEALFNRGTVTVVSVSILVLIWSSSKGFYAMMKGLNAAYNIKETRNNLKIRLLSTLYTVIFMFIIIFTISLVLFGNKLVNYYSSFFPKEIEMIFNIRIIRMFILLFVLIAAFLILYKFVPNRKTKFKKELPGAVFCAVGWVGFSVLYSFYIDNYGNYANIYGSLTGIVLVMLWLYFCMTIILWGAELNCVIQKSGFNIKKHIENRKEKRRNRE